VPVRPVHVHTHIEATIAAHTHTHTHTHTPSHFLAMTTASTPAIDNDAAAGPSAAAAAAARPKRVRKPRVFSAAVDATTPMTSLPCSSGNDNIILKLTFVDAHLPGPHAAPNAYDEVTVNSFVSQPSSLLCADAAIATGGAVATSTGAVMPASEPADMPPAYFDVHAAAASVSDPMMGGMSGMGGIGGMSPQGLSGMHTSSGMGCVIDAVPATSSQGTATGAIGGRLVKLLADFDEKCKTGDWPASTSVHCYWCCHRFSTTPFGLPVQFRNDRFHVMGCFCSLQCASAFNFASRDSVDERLNRYALINALSARLGLTKYVRPAPERVVLKMFGGPLDIEAFRESSVERGGGADADRKHLMVNTPPMLALTQQVEEVQDRDVRSEYRYIPLDNERINRFQEKVRLRRTKPLVDFKNTLDHTMKLRITPAV
jgi:hypothetical protein